MKTMHGLGLAGMLVAVALTVASCGGNAGGGSQEDMQGMDRGGSGGERSSEQASRGETTGGGMSGMGHGSSGGEAMARRKLSDENGDYSDELFIDMMVPHHQGAVEMAEVALENSDREEILDLSRDIVRTQEAEIEELKSIKREEFGTAGVPMDMSGRQMRGMGMMDSQALANERPFDRAFIDDMIPHHESAIDMANVALVESDNQRIRELATDIVDAQEREIAQMKEWRKEWYPEG